MTLVPGERLLVRDGQPVALTPKAFDLLVHFARHPGRLLTKDELLSAVWPGVIVEESNLAYHVFAIRRALGEATDGERFIETVPKQGYRFVTPVIVDESDAAEPAGAANIRSSTLSALPVAAAPRVPRRLHLLWAGVLVIVSSLAAGGVWWIRTPVIPPETRLEVLTPPTSDILSFAISPDGRQLVFEVTNNGQTMFWLRPLETTVARPLAGTEGGREPFWSPDSLSIGFFAGGKLKRLDLAGGAPLTLADATVTSGGAWSRSNVILYRPRPATSSPAIWRISASGGQAQPVTAPPDGVVDSQPAFLPDGRSFVFFRGLAVYLGSLDGTEVTHLTDAHAAARYVAPDRLGYIRDGSLVVQQLDRKGRKLIGDPVPIAEGIPVAGPNRRAGWSVSAGGVVAYRNAALSRRQLIWFDRKGNRLDTVGPVDATISTVELSRDGRRVVVNRVQGASVPGIANVWLFDGPRARQVTFGAEIFPLWSPDGSRIAYTKISNNIGPVGVFVRASNGAGGEQRLAEDTGFTGMTSWSSDGRFILVDRRPNADIWVIPTEPGGKPSPFIGGTLSDERAAQFSPDGRWVSYDSNETSRTEIYIQRFVEPGSAAPAGSKVLVSTAGGTQSRWSADGRELYYVDPAGRLMAVPIAVKGRDIDPGLPVPLFTTRMPEGYLARYAVAPDGRFLVLTVLDDNSSPPITIVQHWAGSKR